MMSGLEHAALLLLLLLRCLMGLVVAAMSSVMRDGLLAGILSGRIDGNVAGRAIETAGGRRIICHVAVMLARRRSVGRVLLVLGGWVGM